MEFEVVEQWPTEALSPARVIAGKIALDGKPLRYKTESGDFEEQKKEASTVRRGLKKLGDFEVLLKESHIYIKINAPVKEDATKIKRTYRKREQTETVNNSGETAAQERTEEKKVEVPTIEVVPVPVPVGAPKTPETPVIASALDPEKDELDDLPF